MEIYSTRFEKGQTLNRKPQKIEVSSEEDRLKRAKELLTHPEVICLDDGEKKKKTKSAAKVATMGKKAFAQDQLPQTEKLNLDVAPDKVIKDDLQN